jgi:2-polyprenyl-3-methyl-5-hydroxy-6-metoxy-1,4-benzoquinol methylase
MKPVENCTLCGSAEKRSHLGVEKEISGTLIRIVKCAACGLVYIDPAPTKEFLSKFYEDTYFTREFRTYEGCTPDPIEDMVKGLTVEEKYMDLIENHKLVRGRMIDIGCSYGSFIFEAATRGWQVEGIEIFSAAVKFGREFFGLPVQQAEILTADYILKPYDVITMWEVIEHIIDPVSCMRRLAEVAAPGAVLALTTPNADCPAAYIFRAMWVGFRIPTHLQFFNHETLPLLLNKAGWRLTKITSAGGYPGQLMAFARKA